MYKSPSTRTRVSKGLVKLYPTPPSILHLGHHPPWLGYSPCKLAFCYHLPKTKALSNPRTLPTRPSKSSIRRQANTLMTDKTEEPAFEAKQLKNDPCKLHAVRPANHRLKVPYQKVATIQLLYVPVPCPYAPHHPSVSPG